MIVPITAEVDVLVVGGGVAGVAAAISAGRQGAKVLLMERQNALGGAATSGMMALFYTPHYCAHGLMKEIVDRLSKLGAAFPGELIPFDHEQLKLLFLDMVEESGANLLFHSMVVDTFMEGHTVKGVLVANKSGLNAFLARVVVDASGDADVAFRGGAKCVVGRESDNKMRPMTLVFRMGGIKVDRVLEYVRTHPEDFSRDPNQTMIDVERNNIRIFGFFSLVNQAKKNGDLYDECHYFRIETVLREQGTAIVNATRIYSVDGTNPFDVTRAETVGRRQMLALQEFARKYIPGFESAYILDSAAHIGVRETRRIVGEYLLEEQDIVEGRHFADAITVDSHRNNPGGEKGHSPDGGEGSADDPDVRYRIAPLITYEIPFGVLVPKRLRNLLVAGRCISSTHSADAFTRNQPACIGTGQAAGTAAALCAQRNITPSELNVADLQQVLEQNGVITNRGEMIERIKAFQR